MCLCALDTDLESPHSPVLGLPKSIRAPPPRPRWPRGSRATPVRGGWGAVASVARAPRKDQLFHARMGTHATSPQQPAHPYPREKERSHEKVPATIAARLRRASLRARHAVKVRTPEEPGTAEEKVISPRLIRMIALPCGSAFRLPCDACRSGKAPECSHRVTGTVVWCIGSEPGPQTRPRAGATPPLPGLELAIEGGSAREPMFMRLSLTHRAAGNASRLARNNAHGRSHQP
jgi:hypothetical protein